MKKIVILLMLWPAGVYAQSAYYGITQSTATGKATLSLSGQLKVAASSSTASTATIILQGDGGRITAKAITLMSSATVRGPLSVAGPVTSTGSINAGSLSAATGTFASSVTASAFFGDGSHLTAVAVSTAGIAQLASTQTFSGINTLTNVLYISSAIQSTGGNARGPGAVDLQVSRTSSSQVASGTYSFVGSGFNNTVSGEKSVVVGGSSNTVTGTYSAIIGGYNNGNYRSYAVVAGGYGNSIVESSGYGSYSVISGGSGNTMRGGYSVIGGGSSNTIGRYGDAYSVISGGSGNTTSPYATYISICGGYGNYGGNTTVTGGNYSSIPGGYGNSAGGDYSTVAGGYGNSSGQSGSYSFVAGTRAKAMAQGAFALSGYDSANYFTVDSANVFGGRFTGGYWLTGGNVSVGTNTASEKLYVYGGNIKSDYGVIASTGVFASSVTASAFFGDGSQLSGIPSFSIAVASNTCGNVTDCYATCPANHYVLGGGCKWTQSSSGPTMGSYPDSNSGWHCQMGLNTSAVAVYVICGNKSWSW